MTTSAVSASPNSGNARDHEYRSDRRNRHTLPDQHRSRPHRRQLDHVGKPAVSAQGFGMWQTGFSAVPIVGSKCSLSEPMLAASGTLSTLATSTVRFESVPVSAFFRNARQRCDKFAQPRCPGRALHWATSRVFVPPIPEIAAPDRSHASNSLTTRAPVTSGSVSRSGRPL